MSKRGIQSANSTNCIADVVVSKCRYSGTVTRKPATAPTSAIQRAKPASRSRLKPRTTTPATIGTQIASDRYGVIATRFRVLYTLLDNKYYFDRFNDWFFAGGARAVGRFASVVGDRTIIDGWIVNGSAKLVAWVSGEFRRIQSGYVYHYAFVMIIGVFGLLYWWVR